MLQLFSKASGKTSLHHSTHYILQECSSLNSTPQKTGHSILPSHNVVLARMSKSSSSVFFPQKPPPFLPNREQAFFWSYQKQVLDRWRRRWRLWRDQPTHTEQAHFVWRRQRLKKIFSALSSNSMENKTEEWFGGQSWKRYGWRSVRSGEILGIDSEIVVFPAAFNSAGCSGNGWWWVNWLEREESLSFIMKQKQIGGCR